jgi:hypothetical protein
MGNDMSYYKIVDGKKFDGPLFELATEAVRKSADGKISLDYALALYGAVIDGGVYTDVERETVTYLLKNFKWRTYALEWFQRELASWEAREMQSIPMTPEALSKETFAKHDVLKEEFDRISRETDLRAATMETYDDHDEIALILRLADGRRVEVKSNLIEFDGEFVELRGGFAVPVRAIEKVEI